jgi:hypothetical protein
MKKINQMLKAIKSGCLDLIHYGDYFDYYHFIRNYKDSRVGYPNKIHIQVVNIIII